MEVRGGGHGALHKPLATAFAPGAQRTRSLSLDTTATKACWVAKTIRSNKEADGVSTRGPGLLWAQGPWPPLLGGGNTVARGSRGGDVPHSPYGRGSSPDGPRSWDSIMPTHGVLGVTLLQERRSGIWIHELIMTTFYSMTTFQTDYMIFFQIRPPEESPH